MRSFRHWTPRYFKNRLAEFYYEKTNPDCPWMTRTANEILASHLTKSDIGLEFGSGRSTIWFANRVSQLTSVEHNDHWAAKVREMLKGKNIKNVEYKHLPKDRQDDEGNDAEYVRFTDRFNADSLDFCLVDGVYRGFCVLRVIEKIRPGGVLIIDDVHLFLPSCSYSPDSRSIADGPKGPVWKEVTQKISGWRKIWTSTGVSDTALFFKP